MNESPKDALGSVHEAIEQLLDVIYFIEVCDNKATILSTRRALDCLNEAKCKMEEAKQDDIQNLKEAVTTLFNYSPVFPGVSSWDWVVKTVKAIKDHHAREG